VWICRKPDGRSLVVQPDGNFIACSRLNSSVYGLANFNKRTLAKLKEEMRHKIKYCNSQCYSNCSFNSAYYQLHGFRFFKNLVIPELLSRKRGVPNPILAVDEQFLSTQG
jgi:radical SAM protein with 4Fe4S-binding SPASM domain